jgi:hypothetical protein
MQTDTNSIGASDKALLLQSQVLSLQKPSSRTLREFKRWFSSEGISGETKVPVLWGKDQYIFEDEHDLVALAPVDSDRLNILLRALGWFMKVS